MRTAIEEESADSFQFDQVILARTVTNNSKVYKKTRAWIFSKNQGQWILFPETWEDGADTNIGSVQLHAGLCSIILDYFGDPLRALTVDPNRHRGLIE